MDGFGPGRAAEESPVQFKWSKRSWKFNEVPPGLFRFTRLTCPPSRKWCAQQNWGGIIAFDMLGALFREIIVRVCSDVCLENDKTHLIGGYVVRWSRLNNTAVMRLFDGRVDHLSIFQGFKLFKILYCQSHGFRFLKRAEITVATIMNNHTYILFCLKVFITWNPSSILYKNLEGTNLQW